jgi:hypothetical protein
MWIRRRAAAFGSDCSRKNRGVGGSQLYGGRCRAKRAHPGKPGDEIGNRVPILPDSEGKSNNRASLSDALAGCVTETECEVRENRGQNCSREDSNLHGLPHTVLSRTRLPIPPRERGRLNCVLSLFAQARNQKSGDMHVYAAFAAALLQTSCSNRMAATSANTGTRTITDKIRNNCVVQKV